MVLLIFLISFLTPALLLRILAHTSHPDITAPSQIQQGPRVHHLHYGIGLTFLAATLFLLTDNKQVVAFLLGLGLSFMLDEFVASVYIPQLEPDNTKVYLMSLFPTAVMFVLGTTFILSLVAAVAFK